MDEASFRARLADLGITQSMPVEWPPGHATREHSHEFNAHGLVLRGSFALTTAEGARVLAAGDSFELAAGVAHTETVGSEGAQLIAAWCYPA